MGRTAGSTAAQTRDRLLRAAAQVFAERGYDGARVADIAAAAGVSNGALYAHFGSKADLLVAALGKHGRRALAEQFVADPTRSILEVLPVLGRELPDREVSSAYLVVEALVAARRDEDVAESMRDYVGELSGWLTDLVAVGQIAGELDAELSRNAIAHLCLLLGTGSRLLTPDLHGVGDEEWTTLMARVLDALRPGSPPDRPPRSALSPEREPGHCSAAVGGPVCSAGSSAGSSADANHRRRET